jgi:hypothetical protein
MSWAVRIANQIRALWKYCLSFRKADFELTDYPISFRTQEPDPASPYHSSRFKFHRHVASIVKWNLTGTGDSREEALVSLKKTFSEAKAKRVELGESLPRPGSRVPIRFAPQGRVRANPELAEDFIHRVLELDWALISDGSSLWDFHTEETNDAFIAKIRSIYGVDVSDIESAKISEILERIGAAK